MENNQEQRAQVQVVPSDELKLIQAKSAAQFALTPIGQQVKQFEVQQRMAQMYATSTIVPKSFQDNLGNCVIAIDMAMRMNANPLMLMQNLAVINGMPTFSAKYLIATINVSGRYSSLDYEFKGKEGTDDWACRVVSYEKTDVEHKKPLVGEWISIKMAKDEKWYDKPGSKWKTMPGQMMRYRAAAFWQRTFCPEISMGFITTEEALDAGIDDQTNLDYREEIKQKANVTPITIQTEPAHEEERSKPEKPAEKPVEAKPKEEPKKAQEAPLGEVKTRPLFMQD